MLLRTFGGLSIEPEAGDAPIPSIGPRRLALLALVASAGARGITRERILGVLWAETNEEQARHTLSQTLYLLKRESGREWITGGSQLRLAAGIRSDVADFQEALNAEDLARAAACYRGPFLQGFYLAGAPQFEEWVEETRARFQFAALKALETLARNCAQPEEAVQWWRRLVEMDPYSATYAAGRIRALISSGDSAGALRFAREYESRVRRELDSAPDRVIGELTASIQTAREENAASAPAPQGAREPAPAGSGGPPSAPERRVRRRWKVWLPVSLAAVSGLAAITWNIRASRASPGASPFLAIGFINSRDSTTSGAVLRDMLATNLARIGGMQVVSNSRLVELLPRGAHSVAATADAARRAGASEIIEGEVGATGSGLMLTLRRVALEGGLVREGYSVRAADAYALIDSATAAIARDFHLDPPPDQVAAVRTRSGVAYALYEEGLRAYHAGESPASLRFMNAALARDSTFAMAAFFAWRSARAIDHYEEIDRLMPIARRLATRAVERERLLIQATLARDDAPLDEAVSIARQLTNRYPSDPDGQIALGFALFAAGDWPGSVAAFERAIQIDSVAGATQGSFCRVCNAAGGMIQSYLWWDSAASAERTGLRLVRLRSGETAARVAMIEATLRQGRRADAESTIAKAFTASAIRPNFAPWLDRDLIRTGRLGDLENRFAADVRSAQPDTRGEMQWLMTIALRNEGRLKAAQRLAAEGVMPDGTRLGPGRDATSLAIIAYERGAFHEAARRFLKQAADGRAARFDIGYKSRIIAWNLTLAGTALAAAGDTAAVRAIADSVERIAAKSSFGRDQRLPYFLRGLLLQRENRQAEAVESFRRALFSVTDGYTRINLEMARSLMMLGRYQEAIAILQPALRGGVDGGNTYVTHTELHHAMAHAFDGAGQRDSARVHYRAVERAWRRGDPEFAARSAEARSKVMATK